MRQFITTGETFARHYTPNTKEQYEQWVEAGGLASKKAKLIVSAENVIASMLWDSENSTSEYNSNHFGPLDVEIRETRPCSQRKEKLCLTMPTYLPMLNL